MSDEPGPMTKIARKVVQHDEQLALIREEIVALHSTLKAIYGYNPDGSAAETLTVFPTSVRIRQREDN